MQRLSSPILSTNPCLHVSTHREMDPEQQSGTRQRKSQLEWTACASTRPTPSSCCRKMPRLSSLTTLSFCIFVGFVIFGVTGVVVGVPAMFMLTRDTFSTSFSIVVWARAGIQFTPSMDSASLGKNPPLESGHGSLFKGA